MKAVTKASAERREGNFGWALSAIGFLSLIAAGLVIIPFGPQMPSSGLDNSWTIALNEALAHGYVFGRDLIFTFGPLGSVYTRLYSPETDRTMMVASAVFAIGFCCAFWLSAYPRRLAFLIVIPIAIALSYTRDPIFLTIPFALLVGVVRLRLPIESKWHVQATPVSLLLLALATIAVAIMPLVKGSFAVSAFFTCALALVLLITWRRGIALCFVGLIVITQVIAWSGAGQPIGYLFHFYIAQAPIIDGYTAAMSLYGNEKASILYVVMALMLLGVTYRYFAKQSGFVGVVVMLGMLANLFLIFKAGFVRHDGHASMSAMSLMITACTLLSLLPIRIGSVMLGASAVIAMLIVGMIGPEGFQDQRNSAIYNVSSTITGIETRITRPDFLRPSYENALKAIAEKTPLPRVSGSVDIYPTELSAVFGNRLDWSGRPVFQSYSAYTPELIKENAEHLDGERAPRTVFFTFFPIDRRMPSADDSLSLMKLLASYDVSSYSAPYIQFDQVNGLSGAALQLGRSVSVSTTNGKEVTVPFRGPTWVSIDAQPSLIGRIADKAYKTPEIYIALTLKGGGQIVHRFTPGIGAVGFILSPYLGTPEDLINLAAGLSSSATVKSFRIETKWPQFWKPGIVVKFTPIQIAPHTGARKVALVEPSTNAPEAIKDGIANTQCAIDMVNGSLFHGDNIHLKSDNTLSAQGWIATPEGMPANEFKTWIVATSAAGEKRYFEARPFARPDVARAFNRADLVDSGFTSMLDTSSLVGPQTLELVTASKTAAFRCPSAITLH
ncbi:hypothetical protein C7410_12966 [Paraburkholderia silvatlantica]|uniref:Uncharacterized protein n=1 Tax=Paraburkholderia silvatlantica TaxID=321895 RepID=A0A2V4TLR2_9BURK|nr:hypothetical protein [Paraburkholderia silvatlantica]PYE16625.1 hypothetical protein C7410_12966 [Paraburkholderia silvatlantica]